MDVDKLILTILETTPEIRQQNIKRVSKQIFNNMEEMDDVEKNKKTKKEKELFETFFKVVQKIAAEVAVYREKYLRIDKEKLKEEKCRKMAKQIHIFKEQCFYLKTKIKEVKKQYTHLHQENQLMKSEHELLKKVCERKKQEKQRIKSTTVSDFWLNDKQKVNTIHLQNSNGKTAFSFDFNTHMSAMKTSQSNQKPRSISTGYYKNKQRPRAYFLRNKTGSNQEQRKSQIFSKSVEKVDSSQKRRLL